MKTRNILVLSLISIPLFWGIEASGQTKNPLSSLGRILGTKSPSNTKQQGTTNTITQTEAITGIKQALSNGLTNSINTLSVKDGFLGNAAVKILMPKEAQQIEKTLRSLGMGSLCDKFVVSLNRAAESAVKEAAPVFVSALSQMTVTDAFNILLGSEQDAATSFFKRTTSTALASKFSPIVESALGKNNVSGYWTQLTSAYNNLPLSREKVNTDLNAYVTQRAIEGLFVQVATEEIKIRQNIVGSRNSNILNDVFGWVDKQK
ncbi:DUF4197 domain-containing protein [Sphingobacterium paucimobilis]|uniref:DUF4197 domain-containing protein n=1 Tax=Sphingobacterium paucimobilis HER1398 TaxID=1346330 RepID=U2I0R0_9SPHI|nr:DUF4197 domain-containing protein [Sphingobacterium paucimobilis]ERJ61095.1 hypothetical protein M472_20300 [Sphingobacterium paucimobilis HER1398]